MNKSHPPSNQSEDEISVAVIGNRGFWIKDNKFMTAILTENHEIDPREAEQVDTYSIPVNQLGYLFKILDKIYEE
jgi:hypothetical protein